MSIARFTCAIICRLRQHGRPAGVCHRRAAAFGDLMDTMHFPMANGETVRGDAPTRIRSATSAPPPRPTICSAARSPRAPRASFSRTISSRISASATIACGIRTSAPSSRSWPDAFTPQNPLGTGFRAYSDFRGKEPPSVWTPYRSATRLNYGFIVRPPGWEVGLVRLRLFAQRLAERGRGRDRCHRRGDRAALRRIE